MVLRQRKGKSFNKVVQELDAFPKVPQPYVEQTLSGAIISLITLILVACLIWSEAQYFLNPGFAFKFVPDADYEAKLSINVDITVAMPCNKETLCPQNRIDRCSVSTLFQKDSMRNVILKQYWVRGGCFHACCYAWVLTGMVLKTQAIGADILDSTNQNTFSFGRLKEESTWFELDRVQRKHFEEVKTFNQYLREEYHAVQELMWRSGRSSFYSELPQRREIPQDPHDACRIYGSLTLNKVSGNFHVTAGKSVPLMRGHAHLTAFMDKTDYNFSHRIDRFSFGSGHVGMVHPLEGDEKIADLNFMNYQYFIQVVPTDIQAPSGLTYSTYQYSVKDQERPIEHHTGSHGVPGIYFKYDMSALKIKANQDREPLVQFLVRLCAGVGGLVATSQLICGVVKSFLDFYCCKREEMRSQRQRQSAHVKATANLISPQERLSYSKEQKAKGISDDKSSFVDNNAAIKQTMTLQEVEHFIKK